MVTGVIVTVAPEVTAPLQAVSRVTVVPEIEATFEPEAIPVAAILSPTLMLDVEATVTAVAAEAAEAAVVVVKVERSAPV